MTGSGSWGSGWASRAGRGWHSSPGGRSPGGSNSGGGQGGPAGGSARSVFGWIGVRVAAVLVIAIVLAGTAGFVLGRANGGHVAAWARSTHRDALWMGNAWLHGGRTPAGLRSLTAHIRGSGISDVYIFAGTLDSAGRLAAGRYASASAFAASFRAECPGVRISAWLGGAVGSGNINLGDGATRDHVLAVAAALLHAGFNGVHYDLAPVTSGDSGLLDLLSETRRLHPDPLSVATPKLEPLPGLRFPAQLVNRKPVFWTSGYLTKVAGLANQVAVLAFNTGMPFQSWYGGYVERETTLALRAVPRSTALVMGVPAYHQSNLGHHAGAETVAAAIHGIRVAVTAAGRGAEASGNTGSRRSGRFGVALYAADSATAMDWTSYGQDWVRTS